MSTMEDKTYRKPHAVCIPYPAQGHINPMMHLAKLLHHSGFHITFVHTVYNYNRLARSRGAASVAGLPDFRFEAIPDGLPPSSTKVDVTQDIPSLCDSTSKTCLGPFKALLARLQSQDTPPPTCIVSDVAMSFTLDAAEELALPVALLWTASACGFLAYAYYQHLVDKSLVPLKDERQLTDGYLDTRVDGIPCMEGIRLRDLPTFLRTTNPDDPMFNFIVRELRRARRGSAIILNTFEALDHDVLDSLSKIYPNIVLPVGPLHVSLDKIPEESPARAISSSLWKKDSRDCVAWLSSKEEGSVIYVNYGSIAVVSREQLVEFAWGLANSKQHFLWIIRPDLVAGDGAILPREFVDGIRGRGLLAGWCDQEEVLSHRSVGGFLTHCGWNSSIESVSAGVPMVCWPFFAEQQTNCWFACGKWGVGLEMDAVVDRGGVERVVREVMEGERGREMKRKAADWKRLAEEAVGSSGSSTSNFDTLVNQVLLSNKNVRNSK